MFPNEPRMQEPTVHPYNSTTGLHELLSSISPLDVCIEVGSHMGVSSETFLAYCQRLICIDFWWNTEAKRHWDLRLAHQFQVSYLRIPSPDAATLIADQSIDLVYLDGDHSYEAVKRDLIAWIPKIKPWGWIAGHDHCPAFDGVMRAVAEICGEVKTFPDSSWLRAIDNDVKCPSSH